MRPEDVLRTVEEKGVEFVDLRFTDLPGRWQHLTVPAERLASASFTRGFAFDGCPLRGGPITDAASIVLLPEPRSAIIDPFCQHTTLAMVCDIQELFRMFIEDFLLTYHSKLEKDSFEKHDNRMFLKYSEKFEMIKSIIEKLDEKIPYNRRNYSKTTKIRTIIKEETIKLAQYILEKKYRFIPCSFT